MENGTSEDHTNLFDLQLIKDIDWETKKASFRDGVSCHSPGDNLVLRPLNTGDYDKGYMSLLSQLTSIGDVDRDLFEERFRSMKACSDQYYIIVIEDLTNGQIIGAASLVKELKFIHSAGWRGRIEDVVVNSNYRGKQLGKLLVETLTLLGKNVGCYKLSLECVEDNYGFYNSHGYKRDGQLFLVQRFDK